MVLCALLGALLGFLSGPADAQQPPGPPEPSNRVIIRLRSGVSAQALSVDGTPPSLEQQGYRSLEVPPGIDPQQFLAQLRTDPTIELAELDVPVFAALTPHDPVYAGSQGYLASIGVPTAWDLETGDHEVIVAVVDTGIDRAHPEFAGRFWENTAEITGDGLDNDSKGCIDDRNGCRFLRVNATNASFCGYSGSGLTPTGAIEDDHGRPGDTTHSHGTLVSGVLAARGNNNLGVTGVAWDARIMTLKVLDCGRPAGCPCGSMFDVALAINYATRMGAKVINLSLASQDASDDIAALRDAILAAKAAGVKIVAAAGNHSGNGDPSPGYPAAYAANSLYPNVISAASSDNTNGNTHAPFSNYGPAISLAAPGIDIAGPVRVALSTSAAAAYGQESGTSFSSPIVAGLFALSESRNPGLTIEERVALAKSTASPPPPGPLNWAGAGIVNFAGAVGRIPVLLTGAALHNWKDVAHGTTVSATIGGVACGQTSVMNQGFFAAYRLLVMAEAEKPGCGAAGRPLQVHVNFQPATPIPTWPVPNATLRISEDVSSVSPAPGPVVVQSLGPGWNLLTNLTSGPVPGSAFLHSSWTALYFWDPLLPGVGPSPGAYRRHIRTAPGYVNTWLDGKIFDAFWVDAASATTVAFTNPCPCSRTISLKEGWNLFTYTGPSKKASDALGGVVGKYTLVVEFNNLTDAWAMHFPGSPRYLNDFEGLMQLQVYWIYMEDAGLLTME